MGFDSPGEFFSSISAKALRKAWDDAPALVAVTLGPDHLMAYQNAAAKAVFGELPLGTPLGTLSTDDQGSYQAYNEVYRTGHTVEVPRQTAFMRSVSGGSVELRYVLSALQEPDGPVLGVVATAVDITAEARAHRLAERNRLLADISANVSAARDAEAGLQALTDALVPALGDLAAVYVAPAPGDPATGAQRAPARVITLAPRLAELGPPPPPRPSPWAEALRSGQPLIISLAEEALPALAADPAGAAWLLAAEGHSFAVAPLVVAGDLTGALVLMACGDRPAYQPEDLELMAAVTARAGAAISHLRNQHQLRRVAERLQSALLPGLAPEVPGISVAARYMAGSSEAEVGGDWWDVFELGEGRIGIGIGDVSGRGVAAAALMGQARVAMRTAGHARLAPAEVLALLDTQLAEAALADWSNSNEQPRYATAVYAVVETADKSLRVANAGHPPLLLRRASGEVVVVEQPAAAPLGLLIGGFQETRVPFEPGDTIALFTDGLVEDRHRPFSEGIAMLAAAFERHGEEEDLGALADQLLLAMDRRPGHGSDDVALVLARPA